MATVTHAVATNVNTGNTPNASSSFTPVAGDLLFVLTETSTSTSTALDSALTASANGITFSAVFTTLLDGSTDKLCGFVANQLVPSSPSSMTVTWSPSDVGAQSIHSVFRISGMQRTGLSAIRQFVTTANNASGTTPGITFSSACLTGNPTILAIGVADSTPAFTAPAGWTESSDTGGTSPAGGLWDGFRNSGFTGTTVNWSSNAGGGYAEAGIEFDTSAPPGPHENLIDTFEHDTTGGTNLSSGVFSVEAGDLLVVKGVITGSGSMNTPIASGMTFTEHVLADTQSTSPHCYIWSAVCPSTTSTIVTCVTTSNQKAFIVEQWRGMSVDATPAVIDDDVDSTPSSAITTEADDSVVSWIVGDINEIAPATPAYNGDGTSILEFNEQYSGAWSWWATHTYDLGTAGSKTMSWSSPTVLFGNIAGVEIQVGGGGDATATPGVIACTSAMTRPAVAVATGPAAAAGTVALAGAGRNVAAGPVSVAAVVSLVRAADNITAGPAAIPTSAAIGLAAAGSPTIVTPAGIACTVAIARPAASTTAGPASVAVAAALAWATDNVTAGPAATAAAVAMAQPGVATSTTPASITAAVTLPQAGASIGAGPLTIASVVALARAAGNTGAGPDTISIVATIPAATIQAGGNITVTAAAVAVTVAVPQATPRGDAATVPAGIPVGVTISGGSRAVTASPGVAGLVASLPAALAFEGVPVVVGAGTARVAATAIGIATYGVGYTGAATAQRQDGGTAAVAPSSRGLAEVTRQ